MTTLKGKIFQVNVSPGGVPTGSVAFGRSISVQDGKKAFAGYVFGAEQSHFQKVGVLVDEAEQAELGLEKITFRDWGSHQRPNRERRLIRLLHEREDKKYHNSQDQLVCLFALERILELQLMGHAIAAGSLGENLTTLGINYKELRVNMLLAVGEENVRGMLLRISSVRTPCSTIEPFARIRNLLDKREGKSRLAIGKDLGFIADAINLKWGGSGFYCSVEEIWGSGIVMVPDQINIRT